MRQVICLWLWKMEVDARNAKGLEGGGVYECRAKSRTVRRSMHQTITTYMVSPAAFKHKAEKADLGSFVSAESVILSLVFPTTLSTAYVHSDQSEDGIR
jgi:hypothetical protein